MYKKTENSASQQKAQKSAQKPASSTTLPMKDKATGAEAQSSKEQLIREHLANLQGVLGQKLTANRSVAEGSEGSEQGIRELCDEIQTNQLQLLKIKQGRSHSTDSLD